MSRPKPPDCEPLRVSDIAGLLRVRNQCGCRPSGLPGHAGRAEALQLRLAGSWLQYTPSDLDQAAGDELLSDLQGVERRALAQVVADDPVGDAVGVREVAPDAADEHRVLARRLARLRVEAHRRLLPGGDPPRRPPPLPPRLP